jgi:aminoglycoside phosphotransferase (APT) family kinase protein
VDLGRPIAVGRTAEVFDWGDGRVLKLIRPEMPAPLGRIEARAMEAVMAAGLAAPRLLETTEIDGRFGLVYERVSGRSMMQTMPARPWRIGVMGRQFARLQAAMHESSGEGLRDVKEYLGGMIERAGERLPAELRAAALDRMGGLPDGAALLHGDLQPGNVVLTPAGPEVIDWLTAARGDPAADIARTLYLLRQAVIPGPPPPRPVRAVVEASRRWFTRSYLAAYRRLRPFDPDAVAAWRPVVLAARLGEGIPEEGDSIVAELRLALRPADSPIRSS